MKFGMRKPSIRRSLKARTTGGAKRAVKNTTNPLYGKKGAGLWQEGGRTRKESQTLGKERGLQENYLQLPGPVQVIPQSTV